MLGSSFKVVRVDEAGNLEPMPKPTVFTFEASLGPGRGAYVKDADDEGNGLLVHGDVVGH